MKAVTVYKTDDGAQFTNPDAARRHQRLVTAERAYKKAKEEYTKALWETQRTADGEPFLLSPMKEYWYIHYYFDMSMVPQLRYFTASPYECYLGEDDNVVLREVGNDVPAKKHRIGDLYAHKRNAIEALQTVLLQFMESISEKLPPEIQVDIKIKQRDPGDEVVVTPQS